MPFVDARGMAAATGITSNVEDMARFVSAQFRKGKMSGNQILSTGSLREMHRVRVLENNWTRGSAIGFAVSREKDKVYIGHGGSYPGYTTQTWIQLDSKIGVIVLTNTNDSNPSDIAMQLMNTVGDAVAKAPAPKARGRVGPLLGTVRRSVSRRWGDQQVLALKDKLVLIEPNASNVDDPIVLELLGGGRFRFVSKVGRGRGRRGGALRGGEREGSTPDRGRWVLRAGGTVMPR